MKIKFILLFVLLNSIANAQFTDNDVDKVCKYLENNIDKAGHRLEPQKYSYAYHGKNNGWTADVCRLYEHYMGYKRDRFLNTFISNFGNYDKKWLPLPDDDTWYMWYSNNYTLTVIFKKDTDGASITVQDNNFRYKQTRPDKL